MNVNIFNEREMQAHYSLLLGPIVASGVNVSEDIWDTSVLSLIGCNIVYVE